MSAPESAAVTPGQAAYEARRDAFYEFLASQGYDAEDHGNFDQDEMELAFETGWQSRQAAIARQPQPAPGGKRDPLSCPCCVFRGDDCWCRTDCGAERCQARDPEPAPGRAELETAMATVLQELIDEDEAVQPAPELAAAKPELGTAWRLLSELRATHAELEDAYAAAHGRIAEIEDERDKYRGELENALRVMPLSRDTADAALAIRERTGLLPLKAVKGK